MEGTPGCQSSARTRQILSSFEVVDCSACPLSRILACVFEDMHVPVSDAYNTFAGCSHKQTRTFETVNIGEVDGPWAERLSWSSRRCGQARDNQIRLGRASGDTARYHVVWQMAVTLLGSKYRKIDPKPVQVMRLFRPACRSSDLSYTSKGSQGKRLVA